MSNKGRPQKNRVWELKCRTWCVGIGESSRLLEARLNEKFLLIRGAQALRQNDPVIQVASR